MRPIDSTIQNRTLQAQQTAYNNAEPKMEIVAVRPRTAIFHERYWQESIVTAGVTAVCTSVAIRRTGRWGDTIFVAYVDDSGVLTVKSAPFRIPIRALSWTTLETISGCTACALEFDGSFRQVGNTVEYRTDALPQLFYVTAGGALMTGPLGGTYGTLANENVTSVDAIRGVASEAKDIDQGLVVFYIQAGSVCYRECIAGTWGDQQTVDIAPANAVAVKAERTFDWRIVLQVVDNTGALYEVFSRMYASGWNGYEYLTAKVTDATVNVIDIFYPERQLPNEYITAGASAVVLPFGDVAAEMRDAWNQDDGAGEWGKQIILRWTDSITNAAANVSAFKLTDAYGVNYYPTAVASTDYPNRLLLSFEDFNNAAGVCTITYTPGTVAWKDGATVSADTVTFTPQNLEPTYIPAPVLTSITSADNRTIRLAFDRPIVTIDPAVGLTVSGFEPFASPAGQLLPTTYAIESITRHDDYTIQIYLTYAGRLKHPQGEVTILYTNGLIGPGPSAVASFSQGFTPVVNPLWFKPNDPEYITITPIATLTCFDVQFPSAKNGDEYLKAAAYAATITTTNVGGLPL